MAVRALPLARPRQVLRLGAQARVLAASHPRGVDLALASVIGLVVFALYNATLTPSLSYISPDGNELATIPYTLGLAHPTGYPLYTWLGKVFTFLPVGDVAHRVNLMSATGGAGACGFLYAILRELRADRVAAATAALALGLSTTLWSQATIAEVYAPNLFFVALEVYLLLLWGRHQRDPEVRRHGDMRSTLLFSGWALTFALSTGMHMSGLGFGPAFAAYILLVNWRVIRQPYVLAPALILFAAGLMQFLWLPIRTVMGEPSPDPINPATVEGFRNYTIDAFAQFKWAYSIEQLPDRFMLYAMLVKANFGWAGIAAGMAGAAGLAIFRPRTFLMLALMWAVHVVFFMEYRAQDLDVFYIPAHFIFAIAIGYGLALSIAALRQGCRRLSMPLVAGAGFAAAVVAFPLAGELTTNFEAHDQSDHTEINDFYRNAYEILPENAVLLGSGGVFGFDMFYYQMVYNVRPDVTLPSSTLGGGGRRQPQQTAGRATYSVDGQAGPGGAFSAGGWSVPVLVAPGHTDRTAFLRRNLVLYQVSTSAPNLIDDVTTPAITLSGKSGNTTLVGADLDSTTVKAGGRVHLKLYYRVAGAAAGPVSLRVGTDRGTAAAHQVGFGLLERYNRDVQAVAGHTVVEEFDFVVLASTEPGEQPLIISVGGNDLTIANLKVE
jgi:hypothetical protein